jgi:hypothetical protein
MKTTFIYFIMAALFFSTGCGEKKPETPAAIPEPVEPEQMGPFRDRTEEVTANLMEKVKEGERFINGIGGPEAAAKAVDAAISVAKDSRDHAQRLLDEASMRSSEVVKRAMQDTVTTSEKIAKVASETATQAIAQARSALKDADKLLEGLENKSRSLDEFKSAEKDFAGAEEVLAELNAPEPTNEVPAMVESGSEAK